VFSIAIDGPAAAGKTSTAKCVAKKLGFFYIDTGAMYRAVALYFADNNIDFTNHEQIKEALLKINIKHKMRDANAVMFLNDEKIENRIRSFEIAEAASKVSTMYFVRRFLLDFQRNLAKKHNVVMEGRDITSVVLPDADMKIFLTAKVKERAKRRSADYKNLGKTNIVFSKVLRDIMIRDIRDTKRRFSPLKQTEDAIIIDNTKYDLEYIANFIVTLADVNFKGEKDFDSKKKLSL
jgi:cytidylate kinase